ncbi:hypothetical protein CDAR_535931 [Caerostris darwini]|uniref:Uncharacterized protein n=1 Tax=Caerostris darwini TaxID=1538125 RepID=A0AAV4QQD2_9ARAC|nr:hypothetical protein CDAR_535931 [Caerostris darwini]
MKLSKHSLTGEHFNPTQLCKKRGSNCRGNKHYNIRWANKRRLFSSNHTFENIPRTQGVGSGNEARSPIIFLKASSITLTVWSPSEE